MQIKEPKLGAVIVTHSDCIETINDIKLDRFEFVTHLMDSIMETTPPSTELLIVDNQSLDYRFSKKLSAILKSFRHGRYSKVHVIHSEINSLSYAWNIGIDYLIKNLQCTGIILLNHDVLVTKSFTYMACLTCIPDGDSFAPLSSSSSYQPLQQVEEDEFVPGNLLFSINTFQGFCFGASSNTFILNKYNEDNYFDPEIEWGYNELEWQLRLMKKGKECLLVNNSYVIHTEDASWLSSNLSSTKTPEVIFNREEKKQIKKTYTFDDYLLKHLHTKKNVKDFKSYFNI